MYLRRLLAVTVAVLYLNRSEAKPVHQTLSFNMFLLKEKPEYPNRFLYATTDGTSRFGPVLEALVQQIQTILTTRRLHSPNAPFTKSENNPGAKIAGFGALDSSENEVDGVPKSSSPPSVVIKPSQTKPGTYEVEVDIVLDDGEEEKREN